jgi:hypothetical protein
MNIEKLKDDKYLFFLETPHNLVCVFDHIRYDRSDADLLSQAQRKYLLNKLVEYGYYHKTGRVLISESHKTKFIFPKQNILGASISDFIKHEKREDQDLFVLTPTQMAIYIINTIKNDTLEILKNLISKHPINLKKIYDHSHNESSKDFINQHFKELERYQDDIIKNTSVGNNSHIGRIF